LEGHILGLVNGRLKQPVDTLDDLTKADETFLPFAESLMDDLTCFALM
jgi:hypothetical protein